MIVHRGPLHRQRRHSRAFSFTTIVGKSSGKQAGSFVILLQLVDAARDVLDAVLQDLLGDLFLIEDDNLIDRAYAMLQILANGQDLADHMGERENALSARSCLSLLQVIEVAAGHPDLGLLGLLKCHVYFAGLP